MRKEFGYFEQEMDTIRARGKGFTPSRKNGQFNRQTRRLIARGKLKVVYDEKEGHEKAEGFLSKVKSFFSR